MTELHARLERRAEDTNIEERLTNARSEIDHWTEYDYVVVNDDLGESLDTVRSILQAERHKRARLSGMPDFIDRLLRSG